MVTRFNDFMWPKQLIQKTNTGIFLRLYIWQWGSYCLYTSHNIRCTRVMIMTIIAQEARGKSDLWTNSLPLTFFFMFDTVAQMETLRENQYFFNFNFRSAGLLFTFKNQKNNMCCLKMKFSSYCVPTNIITASHRNCHCLWSIIQSGISWGRIWEYNVRDLWQDLTGIYGFFLGFSRKMICYSQVDFGLQYVY